MNRHIKAALLLASGVAALCGCGKQETVPQVQYDRLNIVDNVTFELPHALRDGAESYTQYYSERAEIADHFATGKIEECSPDTYTLTDRDGYYIRVVHGTSAKTPAHYMSATKELVALVKDSGVTSEIEETSNISRAEDNGITKLACGVNFTVPFGSDYVTYGLSGYLCLLECHGEQYLLLCGMNDDTYDGEAMDNLLDSFMYTGEESGLYATDQPSYVGELNNQLAVHFDGRMFVNTDKGVEMPSYNAVLTMTPFDTGADHELSFEEQKAQVNRDGLLADGYAIEPLCSGTCAGEDAGIWHVMTYRLTKSGETSYITDLMTVKGRSSWVLSFAYDSYPGDMERVVTELAAGMSHTGYTNLDGTVVEGVKEEPTTEEITTEVTEAPAEETTEASTEEVTTEAPTEATTEAVTTEAATTEAPTAEATTEAATTEVPATEQATTQAATQQKTTPKSTQKSPQKSTKKKKENNSDLDVEW